MVQLDLSRRRVAAISFLSNISITTEDNEDVKPIKMACLKVSFLFSSFLGAKNRPGLHDNSFFPCRIQKYSRSSAKNKSLDEHSSRKTKILMLKSSCCVMMVFPRRSFLTISGMNYDDLSIWTCYIFTLLRRTTADDKEPSHKSEEMDEFNVSSTESLHELHSLTRRRTVSGTCSERSGCSSKELTYVRTIQEHQAVGNDTRLAYVAKNGRIPFVITSILPWQKCQHRSANRYAVNCMLWKAACMANSLISSWRAFFCWTQTKRARRG